MPESPPSYPPEISDVLISYDPHTKKRRPVLQSEAAASFQPGSRPHRVIMKMPTDAQGHLQPEHVDQLLVAAHNEMQRLWEEFRHGQRVAGLLKLLLQALPPTTTPRKVIDVGCGLGYVLRWLAARQILHEQITLLGVDYNAALIKRASYLAALEQLPCRFQVADAFQLQQPGDIYLSSGVLHHFRGDHLRRFFHEQASCKPLAFLHFDIQRSWLAPVGAALFHYARMRLPLAQHDGTLSALRAHPTDFLFDAAAQGAPSYALLHFNPMIPWFPLIRTLHAVIGLHPDLVPAISPLLDRRFRWIRRQPTTQTTPGDAS